MADFHAARPHEAILRRILFGSISWYKQFEIARVCYSWCAGRLVALCCRVDGVQRGDRRCRTIRTSRASNSGLRFQENDVVLGSNEVVNV